MGRIATVTAAFLLVSAIWARADDLTTLSGVTYHQVSVVRVEPDGVTWQHATGMVKVDFTDLPDPTRKAYHYDAGRAAAFQAAQGRAREESAARERRTLQEAETRRLERASAPVTSGAATTDSRPGQLVYRRKAADAALVESAAEGIAAKRTAETLRTKDDGTIYDRRLWAIPRLLTGGYSDGMDFDPHTDMNSGEYQASLHSADGITRGDYLTKSYYQDVERAEAFARGHP